MSAPQADQLAHARVTGESGAGGWIRLGQRGSAWTLHHIARAAYHCGGSVAAPSVPALVSMKALPPRTSRVVAKGLQGLLKAGARGVKVLGVPFATRPRTSPDFIEETIMSLSFRPLPIVDDLHAASS